MSVLTWLLDSDPALRWQVLRDLSDAPPDVVAAERARVATDGWAARLLALRDGDGQWAGGACFPCDFSQGQPWTSTMPTLTLLREGRTVAIGAYFGVDVDSIVTRLLSEQLADGGWNCEALGGSGRASFATTICVLEGLREHERATGSLKPFGTARYRAETYLLDRLLFRRLSTGTVVDPDWLQFSFPTWWHYDVMWALDYFRASGLAPDPRLAEAIALLRSKQQPDGSWLLENTHPGAVHFLMEDGDGHPSRWNTLRALRVLKWYDGNLR